MVVGEIKPEKLFENDTILAFYDIAPKAPVHFLVIPKQHIPTIMDISDNQTIANMFSVIKQLTRELHIDKSGFRVVMNCNENGGQTVHHLHAHVLGGRVLNWPPG
jgi:histidine triad (HIT) family protein